MKIYAINIKMLLRALRGNMEKRGGNTNMAKNTRTDHEVHLLFKVTLSCNKSNNNRKLVTRKQKHYVFIHLRFNDVLMNQTKVTLCS